MPSNQSLFYDQFIARLNELFTKIYNNDQKIVYNGLTVKKPVYDWREALTKKSDYVSTFYINFNTEALPLFFIPFPTSRNTFIVRGEERVPLNILYPEGLKEKKTKELFEVERTRDLKGFIHKEANPYDLIYKFIEKEIKIQKNNDQLDLYSSQPSYFHRGMEGPLEVFRTKIGIRYFPYLDSTNPLSELEHLRKFVFLRGERAKTGKDVHPSHYGRLCVVETPESEKIGMRLHLAHKAEIDSKNKKIVFPVKEIETGKVLKVGPDFSEPIGDFFFKDSKENQILVRGEEDAFIAGKDQIKYMDQYPDQLFGFAALQIPFIHHNDPARALMGAKNLKQALPLKNPELPVIQTGYERDVAELSGRLIKSEHNGTVIDTNKSFITIQSESGKEETYNLMKDVCSVMSKTAVFQQSLVKKGDGVSMGQTIAQGAGMQEGCLALGVNLLVAYMPFFGYNMDDGVVLSDRAAEKLTSLHIERHLIQVEIENKEPALQEWEEMLGMEKVPPDYILSWKAEHGTQTKKGSRLFSITFQGKEYPFFTNDEMAGGILQAVLKNNKGIMVFIKKERPLKLGDKIMGRHGNKSVVGRIIPEKEMPYFEVDVNGEKEKRHLEMIMNPHSVITRMNIGQLYETHFGWIAREHSSNDIRKKASECGRPFHKVNLNELSKLLKECGLNKEGKTLINLNPDMKTKHPVVVGYQYMVKLNHFAEGKISVRGTKGPVSFITEMPLSGRKVKGGQRIGEMEVWALLAHGATGLVKEFLGELSNAHIDDATGAIGISESLKVLVFYLRGLGINLQFLDKDKNIIEPEDFASKKRSDIARYRALWADDGEMMMWGRRQEHNDVYSGSRNITRERDLESQWKDEFGYIQLNNPVRLCGRDVGILPVIPKRCRSHKENKINKRYKEILTLNNILGRQKRNNLDTTVLENRIQKKVDNLEKELKRLLSGKNGIIRRAILGKRVNLSSRAVIVPNPDIRADEATVPPKIMEALTINENDMILLNRQPTLHIHNMQALRAIKGEGDALGINPLVCAGFNADFDGDTMALYKVQENLVPENMNVSAQLLLSSNGMLNLNLSQDIISGIYYASADSDGIKEFIDLLRKYSIEYKVNQPVDKKTLNEIIYRYLLESGDPDKTLRLAEEISMFGFYWATRSGLTFSIFDIKEISLSNILRNDAYVNGKYDGEYTNAIQLIESKLQQCINNPVATMSRSGARGDIKQIMQMAGIKGFVDRMAGKKTRFPILANYLTGFSPTEYYLACYGPRNSLGDKKLLTPDCGYLTRRLIFAGSSQTITEEDCGTNDSIMLPTEMVTGRTVATTVTLSDLEIQPGTEIDQKTKQALKSQGINEIPVRSPLTCATSNGLCKKCYGWNLSTQKLPSLNFNAGIMAAEVIGERATQDAMRTYHKGAATGTIKTFDRVKTLFDNIRGEASESIGDLDDRIKAVKELYDLYEKKVDIKHYEVILRSLTLTGVFIGTKAATGNSSPLHRASFERALDTFIELAGQQTNEEYSTTIERLFI